MIGGPQGCAPRLALDLEALLVGRPLPEVQLQYADEAFTSVTMLARRWSLVLFFYPGSGASAALQGDEAISADERRAVAWMHCEDELAGMGYEVIGISTQSAIEQARFASRDPLPYMLLSDPTLKLADALGLPTSSDRGRRVYEPLSLVVHEQQIVRVFRPFDPASETASITRWIRECASK